MFYACKNIACGFYIQEIPCFISLDPCVPLYFHVLDMKIRNHHNTDGDCVCAVPYCSVWTLPVHFTTRKSFCCPYLFWTFCEFVCSWTRFACLSKVYHGIALISSSNQAVHLKIWNQLQRCTCVPHSAKWPLEFHGNGSNFNIIKNHAFWFILRRWFSCSN